MHTEKEAKKLWCPMVHSRITVILAAGESDRLEEAHDKSARSNCIGSQCAMWREAHRAKPDQELHPGTVIYTETVGYCGLAGRPQGAL